ncbi:Gfo/Idh/MocA family protein [Paracoccaceae bacterium GXU_MW_L88]
MAKTIGWALIGSGPVSEKFARGLEAAAHDAKVACVASRRRENAARLAESLGAEVAEDYAAAVAMPGVDAVYIATPPALHEDHAKLAIAAGKAVLIEKPFALDAEAATRIADAAKAANVFCMEAMWTRFMPLIAEVQKQIADGKIGEIRQLQGQFCGADVPRDSVSLFDPAAGGGALMHRGIYPLSLARAFCGPVDEMQAMARIGSTAVDEEVMLTLRHAGGALSNIRASLRSTGPNMLVIQGERGTIRLEAPIYRPPSARLFRIKPREGGTGGGGKLAGLKENATVQALWQRFGGAAKALRPGGSAINAPYAGNGYGHEADAVAEALEKGVTAHQTLPLEETVEIMKLVDQAKATWSTGA